MSATNAEQLTSRLRARVQDVRQRAKTMVGERPMLQNLGQGQFQLGQGKIMERVKQFKVGDGKLLEMVRGKGILQRGGRTRTQTTPQEEITITGDRPGPAPKTTDLVRIITN